jgi:hypothetical protein
MRPHLILRTAILASLLAPISDPLLAADSAAQVNAELKAGRELGWVIKKSISADADLAVLFTARASGAQPADFPELVDGVRPDDTDVFTGEGPLIGGPYGRVADQMMIENVIVSLKEKRVLGRLELDEADVCVPPFTSVLQVLWGPANAATIPTSTKAR